MQAVKKSALSCTARAVLHSTFLPKLERDSGEHSRYLCSSHFWIPYPLWFAYPKDQVCVLTVRLFYWSSYCSKTLLLIHCGVIFLSQCIYFNTSSQSQRQGMSSATIVWRCYPCMEYRPCRWLFSARSCWCDLGSCNATDASFSLVYLCERGFWGPSFSASCEWSPNFFFRVCLLTVWLSILAPCALRDQYSLTFSPHTSWLFLGSSWITSLLTQYVFFLTVVLGVEEFISLHLTFGVFFSFFKHKFYRIATTYILQLKHPCQKM